jgi:hypothetical protein
VQFGTGWNADPFLSTNKCCNIQTEKDRMSGRFWRDERAQDVTEFTLLLAFVVIAAAAAFTTDISAMANIWSTADGIVNQAAIRAGAS